MADLRGTPTPAAGAREPEQTSATERTGRAGAWRPGLVALALAAVVGGLVGAVVSAADEPRPPDLGGPILARGALPSRTPAPTAPAMPSVTPSPMPLAPSWRSNLAGTRALAATAVPARPLALPVEPSAAPATAAPVPGTGLPVPSSSLVR